MWGVLLHVSDEQIVASSYNKVGREGGERAGHGAKKKQKQKQVIG